MLLAAPLLPVLWVTETRQVGAEEVPADYLHVRVPSYACIDPRATSSLVERATHHVRLREYARRLGGCFHIHPSESWELLSKPDARLLLMRRVPPHPGEPPLYFQTSLVERQGAGSASPAHPATDIAPPAVAVPQAPTPAVGTAPLPAVSTTSLPAVGRTPLPAVGTTAMSLAAGTAAAGTVTKQAPVAAATRVMAPGRRQPASSAAPRHAGLFMLWIGPMLAWAVLAGLAAGLLRLVLRRRRPQAAIREALEAAPLPRMRLADRRLLRAAPTAAPVPPPARLATPPASTAPVRAESSLRDYRSRCVARLRHAGWDARPPLTMGIGATDVLASNGSLVVALRCLPSSDPVGVEAVEDACLARERHRSDLGAIVSDAPFTASARELATSTGIVLLREDELASLAA